MKKKSITVFILFMNIFLVTLSAAEEKEKEAPFSIETSYKYFEPESSFIQNGYGIETKYDIGRIAGINFNSKLSYQYYYTETDSNHYFPENIHKLNLSLNAKGEKLLLYGSASYDSDKLFEHSRDAGFVIFPSYNIYKSGSHHFYLGLAYIAEKQYLGPVDGWNFIPLPSYMYISKNFQLVLAGIANSLHWDITPWLSYDFSIDLNGGGTSVNLKPADYLTVSISAESVTDTVKIADRTNKDERLQKSGYDVGLKAELNYGRVSIWGYTGYSFDNSYYLFDIEDEFDRYQKIKLEDSWVYKAGVKGRF